MNPKIISEAPISMNDLSKELKKIKTRDTEFNIRAKKLDDYLNNFIVLKEKEAEDIEKEIIKLDIPRLKDFHVKKIVDIVPESVDELKTVLSAYPVTISKENLKKIVDVILKHYTSDK